LVLEAEMDHWRSGRERNAVVGEQRLRMCQFLFFSIVSMNKFHEYLK
jgi:hypothetical protein